MTTLVAGSWVCEYWCNYSLYILSVWAKAISTIGMKMVRNFGSGLNPIFFQTTQTKNRPKRLSILPRQFAIILFIFRNKYEYAVKPVTRKQGTIYHGNGTAVTQTFFELNFFYIIFFLLFWKKYFKILIEVGERSQQGAHFEPILMGTRDSVWASKSNLDII